MSTKTSVLEIPKMRKFVLPDKTSFCLSKGMVTEDGKPKIYINWWDSYQLLAEKGLTLPTLYQTRYAATQYQEIHDSVFSYPAEWQNHLILKPNTKTETEEYVLMDSHEKILTKSKKPRLINPVSIQKEGEKKIVIADVSDLFKLKDGRYDLEDIDPSTGFLKAQPKSKGAYGIWFWETKTLYAVRLHWFGCAGCNWGPGRSRGVVGFRGSTGNQGQLPEELFESEADVLQAKLNVSEAKLSKLKTEILGEVGELKSDYSSAFEKLKAMEQKIKGF